MHGRGAVAAELFELPAEAGLVREQIQREHRPDADIQQDTDERRGVIIGFAEQLRELCGQRIELCFELFRGQQTGKRQLCIPR